MKHTKHIGKILLTLFLFLLLSAVCFIGFLWITEYRPQPVEPAQVHAPTQSHSIQAGSTLKLLSYNIGYAGLGENQDFFMDGGRQVYPDAKQDVEQNLAGITQELLKHPADLYLLQEVDEDATRSYHTQQVEHLSQALQLGYTYTYNYKCHYVPYPWPPLGSVSSGLMTLSSYPVLESQRIALPVPFQWPVRLVNLKRCLLLNRYAIEGSDQQLVVINLHLEAYDDGEGKTAQTLALRNLIEAEYQKGNYIVAGGDWNQLLPGTPPLVEKPGAEWKPGILDPNMIPEGWTLAVDPDKGTDRLTNRPYNGNESQAQIYAIDGLLLSPNVKLLKVSAIDTQYKFADHLPLSIEVQLKTP